METARENPYAAPSAALESVSRAASGVTDGMLTQLRGTRGWLRMFSIIFMFLAAIMLLGGLGMVAGSAELGFGSFVYVIVGLYVIGAAFYGMLAVYLFRCASAITRAVTSGSSGDVQQALSLQRRFWRISSILGIVGCVLGAISIAALPLYRQYLEGPLVN